MSIEAIAKISGREVTTEDNYLDPVTYIPSHAEGNAGHADCELGVIISVVDSNTVRVLYCSSRTVQRTMLEDLVFG